MAAVDFFNQYGTTNPNASAVDAWFSAYQRAYTLGANEAARLTRQGKGCENCAHFKPCKTEFQDGNCAIYEMSGNRGARVTVCHYWERKTEPKSELPEVPAEG